MDVTGSGLVVMHAVIRPWEEWEDFSKGVEFDLVSLAGRHGGGQGAEPRCRAGGARGGWASGRTCVREPGK